MLKKILNVKILLASVKTLTNSETFTESRKPALEFFCGLLSLSLVGFLHVITSRWTGEKSG
jgi:hypothetical protein